MYPSEPLRVCRRCAILHYDNCPDCWGFGVYDAADTRNGVVPVSADAALGGGRPMPPNARACPTCHSTAAGVPPCVCQQHPGDYKLRIDCPRHGLHGTWAQGREPAFDRVTP